MKRTPEYAAPVPEPVPDDRIVRWLRAHLRELRGVPLGYLVPDLEMLPPESLRFFALDRAWLDALCDGALSLRGTGPGDGALRAAAIDAAATPVVSGFVLRSAAVWRWPRIEVDAFRYGDGAKLRELRCDRPAPDVLFGLYAGPLGSIELSEPAQTLHYGVRDEHAVRPERRVLDVDALRQHLGAETPAQFARALVQPAEGTGFSSGDAR